MKKDPIPPEVGDQGEPIGAVPPAGELRVTITRIKPISGWSPINLREIWECRDLLRLLAWRDIRVRYKQTVLGAAWAVLQPVLTMAVFNLFFGRLAKVPSGGLPYPIFAFAALVLLVSGAFFFRRMEATFADVV
jgi:lipopolysaccharide transport system permease protein